MMEPPQAATIQHPLQMPVVAQTLLKFIPRDPPSSFSTFRLVCQSWRSVSQVIWTQLHGTLTLYNTPISDQDKEGGLQLSDFYNSYSDPTDNFHKYPFKKYQLRFWNLQPNHFIESEVLGAGGSDVLDLNVWFWTTIAPLMKHVTLYHCNNHGDGYLLPFPDQFFNVIRNVTHFKIVGGSYSPIPSPETSFFTLLRSRGTQVKLESLHLELVLPPWGIAVIWEIFRRSLSTLKNLKIRIISPPDAENPPENNPFEYKIFRLFFPLAIGQKRCATNCNKFDKLDIIDYFSSSSAFNPSLTKGQLRFEEVASLPGAVEGVSVLSFGGGDGGGGGNGLEIFVNPFAWPTDEIPGLEYLDYLEELHLWGGICCGMEFLEVMRNLKVVKWNVRCFGDKRFRGRVLKFLRKGERGGFRGRNPYAGVKVVVGRNKMSEEDLRWGGGGERRVVAVGKELRRLEMDFKWPEGWRGVGRRVVGLKELKGVVVGDEELRKVGELWGGGLERLECGHGSGGFTKRGVVEVVVEGMARLKEFRWRGCPCLRIELGGGKKVNREWREVEDKLRGKLGEGNFTLPWMESGDGRLEGMCLEKKWEEVVKTGKIEKNVMDILLTM